MGNNGHKYYRHFKGGLYEMIAIGQDSETCEQVVIYKALYGEQKIWVRPYKMFFEKVNVNGKEQPRFSEISQEEAFANMQQHQ